MASKILYTKPSITSLEVEFATDAAKNGWGEECYAYIDKFEHAFRKYTGSDFSISASSCTGALHMGLKALGVGQGDEVILADTNWIATVSPIVHLGATPIFVDVDPENWCIDPQKVSTAITSKTKAIIATHLYGNLCDMDKLQEIAKKYRIALIEDAAEAIGSIYKGKVAGSIGTFGVFSFHGTKTITTGEGGMLVTNDQELFEKVTTLSNHGRVKGQPKQFWSEEIGFKLKMSNIQAAMGCAQISRIKELIAKKQYILKYYKEALKKFEILNLNPEKSECIHGAWMPTVVFSKESGITRELLQKEFTAKEIETRVFFWPLSSLPMFNNVNSNKHSYSIPGRAINLPSYHDLNDSDLDRVINCLANVITDKIPLK